MEQVNSRLRQIRTESGLSQSSFGESIGCSKNVVAFIELGRSTPRYDLLVNVSNRFRISLDWLCKGTGKKRDD
jgi:transcriptional regulator with XRE-family HTH domain